MKKEKHLKVLKQSLFLIALHNKIKAIEDPNPDIITHDSFEYHSTNLKGIGIIPKITFTPYGKSTQIKAEIIKSANIYDKDLEREIDEIRTKFSPKKASETENRILARRFESYWNNYWRSIRTALNRIEQAQQIFITISNQEKSETISEPMRIMMGTKAEAVVPNEAKKENEEKKSKSYMDELLEVE